MFHHFNNNCIFQGGLLENTSNFREQGYISTVKGWIHMLFRIVKKDLRKQKTINIMVGLFILLSGLLIASGTTILVDMTGSIQTLFTKSKPPHFVQMHAGLVKEEEDERFAKKHE